MPPQRAREGPTFEEVQEHVREYVARRVPRDRSTEPIREDITQQVASKVWAMLGSGEVVGDPLRFSIVLAKREIASGWRSKSRRQSRLRKVQGLHTAVSDEEAAALSEHSRVKLKSLLVEACASLEPMQGTALREYLFRGATYEQIAAKLRLRNRQAAGRLLKRALDTVAKRLASARRSDVSLDLELSRLGYEGTTRTQSTA